MSLHVHVLTFNPFQENTYIISAPSGECIIIDPGCFDQGERDELTQTIKDLGLKPVRLINTHCHIDHILGNAFVAKTWDLGWKSTKGKSLFSNPG